MELGTRKTPEDLAGGLYVQPVAERTARRDPRDELGLAGETSAPVAFEELGDGWIRRRRFSDDAVDRSGAVEDGAHIAGDERELPPLVPLGLDLEHPRALPHRHVGIVTRERDVDHTRQQP